MDQLDVLIIGAGPIGLACGIEASKAGLAYTILDKGPLVHSIYNYPSKMTFFSTSEKLEIGNVPFVSIQSKPTRDEALEYYRRVALHWDLNVRLFEEVLDIKPKAQKGYEITSSKGVYEARYIILAMGFYDIPHRLNVPGEELPKVSHYYKEAHPYFKQNLAIIGAANSAVDAALESYRKGAQVTMIIRGSQIGSNVKYWAKPDIENRIKEGSIKAYFDSEVVSIQEGSITIRSADGKFLELENDFVLALTGYQPNFEFLQKIGVRIAPDNKCIPIHDAETMETNLEGIYLAGVICGGLETNKWFIENSRIHANHIIADIHRKLSGRI